MRLFYKKQVKLYATFIKTHENSTLGDILFLHSNSTYFAKAILLTLFSQLCSMRKSVYWSVWIAFWETDICTQNKLQVANMQFSASTLSYFFIAPRWIYHTKGQGWWHILSIVVPVFPTLLYSSLCDSCDPAKKKDYKQDYLIPNPSITYYEYRALLYT